ncbi:hypothetical protein [Caulobacter sp. UC70_42]|uniref:hypothetical protein n=1 Tax=Caulobacter sp. UC70_42 TaxID=3374551 RepID=UPI003756E17B
MTPDEFVTQGREALVAGEAWLEANGRAKDLKRVKKAHAMLESVAQHYVGTGVVQPLSVGGDKPPPPTNP